MGFACRIGGITVFLLGFNLVMWAWWHFWQSGTPAMPSKLASSLVTTGPFRFSRNPMYLGITAMLLAVAWWLGSWPMLIAPVGFLEIMSLVRIPHEEQQLRAIFGGAYTAYAKKVRRWI